MINKYECSDQGDGSNNDSTYDHVRKVRITFRHNLFHADIASDMTYDLAVNINRFISGTQPAPVTICDNRLDGFCIINFSEFGFTEFIVAAVIQRNIISIDDIHIIESAVKRRMLIPRNNIKIFNIFHVA